MKFAFGRGGGGGKGIRPPLSEFPGSVPEDGEDVMSPVSRTMIIRPVAYFKSSGRAPI